MRVQILKDSEKNCSVLIKGFVWSSDFGRTLVLDLDKTKAPSNGLKGIRLDSAVWVIQEKLGLILWWEDEDSEASFVLPMESRNSLRIDEGISSPRGERSWGKKLYLSSFNYLRDQNTVNEKRSFFLILDFDKQ